MVHRLKAINTLKANWQPSSSAPLPPLGVGPTFAVMGIYLFANHPRQLTELAVTTQLALHTEKKKETEKKRLRHLCIGVYGGQVCETLPPPGFQGPVYCTHTTYTAVGRACLFRCMNLQSPFLLHACLLALSVGSTFLEVYSLVCPGAVTVHTWLMSQAMQQHCNRCQTWTSGKGVYLKCWSLTMACVLQATHLQRQ